VLEQFFDHRHGEFYLVGGALAAVGVGVDGFQRQVGETKSRPVFSTVSATGGTISGFSV
jgi:hypothetical protein